MLDFIELRGFTDEWKVIGLTDDDLFDLQLAIVANPRIGKAIAGTGGLRKIRFAPRGWKSGKSAGARVCYAYFDVHAMVVLIKAYAKNRKGDVTPAEKRQIQRLIRAIKQQLGVK